MKCGPNDGAPGRLIQKGPSQNVIDKLTVDRIKCGEKAQSVVDVNEIMLRCDVNSIKVGEKNYKIHSTLIVDSKRHTTTVDISGQIIGIRHWSGSVCQTNDFNVQRKTDSS